MTKLVDKSRVDAAVTEIYITAVQHENVPAFRTWLQKPHQLEANFPGFQKLHVQVPQDPDDDNWVTLIQFDTEEHLKNWLDSPERQAMLADANSVHTLQSTKKFHQTCLIRK